MVAERAGNPWRSREEGSLLLGSSLWAAGRLRPILAALGIEPTIFRELLRVRVLLALRPASSSGLGVGGIVLALMMTWLAGLGTGVVGLVSQDAGTWVVISQSALALLLTLMLFMFLAGILVDPTDIGVVAPHPVPDRTLFAARLAEVFAYLLVFTASFTAGNVLLAVFAMPPLVVLFVYPLLSLLCALTTLGAVALLFALCLRIVGPAHFQRVTLWVQILGGALLFLGLQAPRFVHREQWGLWLDQLGEQRFLWPPFLYAELFALASGAGGSVGPSLAALLLPLVALAVTFALASRYFVAGLQGTLGAPAPRSSWEGGWMTGLGARLTRGPERAGFDFAAALSRREPHFLRAVLPQLAMFQVMSLGMGFGMRGDLAIYLPVSAAFLFMVLPNVLVMAQATPTPEAGLLFAVTPLEDERLLLRGSVKALLVQWIGTPALVLFVVQLLLAGLEALPRAVLAFELAFAAALLLTRRFELHQPFTRTIELVASGINNLGLVMLSGLVMSVLVGVHVVLALHPLSLTAGIVLAGLVLVRLWRGLDGLTLARTKPIRAPRVPVAPV